MPSLVKRSTLYSAVALFCASAPSFGSDWTVTSGGAFQHDHTDYRIGSGLEGNAHTARRSRLGVRARHVSGIELRAEWDFASGNATDLFADLPLGPGKLRLGQFKQPFTLEEQGSSRDLSLIERSLAHDASNVPRRVGLMWMQKLGKLQVQASGFAGNAEQVSGSSGAAFRAFSVHRPDLHLGLALAYQQRDDERLRLRARPESRLLPLTPLDFGSFRGVDHDLRLGLEGALLKGSWTFDGEGFLLQGQGGGDPEGAGGFVRASWLSRGYTRSLRDGALRKPSFEKGDAALELAARVSRVEFDLGGSHLGAQTQVGVAATLYFGAHWQFTAEHSDFDASRSLRVSRPGSTDGRFTTLRAQFSF